MDIDKQNGVYLELAFNILFYMYMHINGTNSFWKRTTARVQLLSIQLPPLFYEYILYK